MLWNSLTHLLCAISEHVGISEERFDDVLDILDPVLSDQTVKEALEKRNADAVWLRLYKKSRRAAEESEKWEFAAELGGPIKEIEGVKEEWGFVRL
ncbi:uncharacterized protein N0V89_003758 [Didymosphaeria variabile]|uniref:Uncharacterized protein n=1 Tax=Didymosphaeria variabile TaxID=1932322 RepID=A0A9W8XN75_9PLEO|nr:uncharacterized protein N0V89_003758 [Didymosphaeria variabile]KAJ4355738.1 hypothetical protein N0V89_003758 [Didymosphaeria variabile]